MESMSTVKPRELHRAEGAQKRERHSEAGDDRGRHIPQEKEDNENDQRDG